MQWNSYCIRRSRCGPWNKAKTSLKTMGWHWLRLSSDNLSKFLCCYRFFFRILMPSDAFRCILRGLTYQYSLLWPVHLCWQWSVISFIVARGAFQTVLGLKIADLMDMSQIDIHGACNPFDAVCMGSPVMTK